MRMAVSVEATQLVICLNGRLTVIPLTANPLGSTIILSSSTTPKSSAWSGHIERVIGWEMVKAARELIRIEARYR